jgi:ketosteroid isomerase-like protein
VRISHRSALALAGTFAALTHGGSALAQDDPKAQFQARYTELRGAMEAHDAATLGKVLAPDYQMTDISGQTHDGAEVMERMAQMAGKSADPSRHADTAVLAATITGDTATVEQQLSAGGKRAGDDGEEHTMEMVAQSTDSWAKRGDAWVLVKSVQTGITVKRDGEVLFKQGK